MFEKLGVAFFRFALPGAMTFRPDPAVQLQERPFPGFGAGRHWQDKRQEIALRHAVLQWAD